MARSHREEEVVIKLDDINENSKKINGSPSSNNFQGRSESVRRRNKELYDQENHQGYLNSGGAEVVKCSSNVSFQRGSWKPVMSITKSRLIDPPEEPCQSSVNSGRMPEKDQDYEDDDDTEDIPQEYKRIKFSTLTMLQFVSLILIIAALVCSLWFPFIKRHIVCDLPLWKWEIMVLALICGRLVSGWGIRLVVFYIERNFLLRKRVLYFVYGLRRSVQNCLWLGLVLLVWHSIFHEKVTRKTKSKILPYLNKVLVCFLVGTVIWLLKTLLVKVLASKFHVNTFFQRIQEALFNQYVIKTLSSPPLFKWYDTQEEEAMAEIQELEKAKVTLPGDPGETLPSRSRRMIGNGRLEKSPKVGKNSRFLRKRFKREDEEISIDQLHKLNQKNISAWNMRRLVNIIQHGDLSTLDEQLLESKTEDEALLQIRSECQAKEAAKRIFQNVAKPGSEYIYLEDVMHFMSKEEALKTMHLFGVAAENKGFSKSFFKDWVMVVDEMNILTTVFLRFDNQKIIYPNSILATKPISNYNRSPDMGDAIDFCINISTPMEKVTSMKERITRYIEIKNEHWQPGPMVIMRDVIDMNKLMMSVWLTHKMNYQDIKERWIRRELLLEEMIKVFKELDIEYRLLPLDVNVRNLPPLVSDRLPSTWKTFAS
ncbi:mechanosensitive ion channel protein 8-like isoform X2 [Quercus robur]|uniref:mechanosensitive ion channel protein 8-like isoform X2 n=1 Tax=Quercus robur TaxID=38942 RepID=UPI0021624B9D|nr:mechanosensitive ion channel protein 8-like isoform X2 [Quercus robur]